MPLMPKATAVWLIENTSLTFEQISEFCSMHIFEVQALADSEIRIFGSNPIKLGQLSFLEIQRCELDSSASLEKLEDSLMLQIKKKSKKTRQTKKIQ